MSNLAVWLLFAGVICASLSFIALAGSEYSKRPTLIFAALSVVLITASCIIGDFVRL